MKLLKSLVLALAVTSFVGVAPSAVATGKIENATTGQVKEAIESALKDSTSALDGLKNGASKETVLEHITNARQATKRIEVGTTLDPIRSKASGQLRAANAAVNKDEKDKAETALSEAIKGFEHINASYK